MEGSACLKANNLHLFCSQTAKIKFLECEETILKPSL
jgi:hypothetical protein